MARDFAVEGNDTSGYVGVSPEYQTYANETEAPLRGSDDEVQARVAEHDALVAHTPVGQDEADEADAEGDEDEGEDEGEDDEPEPEQPEPEQPAADAPKRTAPPA